MVDVTYEDYQDLVRKLSLANERIRDLQERVSGREAYIAALKAQLAAQLAAERAAHTETRKALERIEVRTRSVPSDTAEDDKRDKYHANSIARRALTGGKDDA